MSAINPLLMRGEGMSSEEKLRAIQAKGVREAFGEKRTAARKQVLQKELGQMRVEAALSKGNLGSDAEKAQYAQKALEGYESLEPELQAPEETPAYIQDSSREKAITKADWALRAEEERKRRGRIIAEAMEQSVAEEEVTEKVKSA